MRHEFHKFKWCFVKNEVCLALHRFRVLKPGADVNWSVLVELGSKQTGKMLLILVNEALRTVFCGDCPFESK